MGCREGDWDERRLGRQVDRSTTGQKVRTRKGQDEKGHEEVDEGRTE